MSQPTPDAGERADEILVDARGLRCPLPVIEAAKAAVLAAPGTRLRILSTDPASEPDLAAWARLRRYRLLDLTVAEGTVTAIVQIPHVGAGSVNASASDAR